ncbi:hypothetical protein [Solibacillus isronensis]|uniref:hypothetical protein n=1 Tax=Solibacillus isronensis TaxID=412383 RepID=UPI0009A79A06|nr:hypothetical protein [Solibacillus isronensis]
MKQIFAFESIEEYKNNADSIAILNNKLTQYKQRLINEFELKELPKTIVWTTSENAMTVFSKKPVPAYTNKDTIFITPNVEDWKEFYLSLLENEGLPSSDVMRQLKHYFQSMTIDDVFCVLAHELTHHIELFPDEFEDARTDSIWFEEGMCEYLSQKLTLTEQQYNDLKIVEQLMIDLFKNKYGNFSLDAFGTGSYNESSVASVMLNYWRSSAAIHYLVEHCHSGDVMKVFKLYHEWHEKRCETSLTEFFGVSHF